MSDPTIFMWVWAGSALMSAFIGVFGLIYLDENDVLKRFNKNNIWHILGVLCMGAVFTDAMSFVLMMMMAMGSVI
jgi:hypothetical protein